MLNTPLQSGVLALATLGFGWRFCSSHHPSASDRLLVLAVSLRDRVRPAWASRTLMMVDRVSAATARGTYLHAKHTTSTFRSERETGRTRGRSASPSALHGCLCVRARARARAPCARTRRQAGRAARGSNTRANHGREGGVQGIRAVEGLGWCAGVVVAGPAQDARRSTPTNPRWRCRGLGAGAELFAARLPLSPGHSLPGALLAGK